MKSSEMEAGSDVEACRTCGIFFLTSSNYLRHIFSNEIEMVHVRQELGFWKIQLTENDRFPQYICTVCLMEFHKIFKFQSACLETQQQLCQLYTIQQENMKKMKIKTEIFEDAPIVKQEPQIKEAEDDENVCAFIYVDDLSDSEETTVISTPFKMPHLPIKQEIIGEAKIPEVNNENFNKLNASEMSVLTLTESEEFNSIEENDNCNNRSNSIECDLCMHISEDQQQHRQHLLRVHESKPLECHICGKQFKAGTTNERFKFHLKWHRINKHIKCPQCGFHCASRDILNEHTRAVHIKTPCTICGKHLLPKKMRNHMKEHEKAQNKPISECPYCLNEFDTTEERDQHILLAHSMKINQDSSIVQFAVPTSMSMSNIPIQIDFNSSETASGSGTSHATTSTNVSFSPDQQQVDNFINSEKLFAIHDEEANDVVEVEMESGTLFETFDEGDDNDGDYDDYDENSSLSFQDEMQFACAECTQTFVKVEQLIAHSETHKIKSSFDCHVCGKKFELKFSLNRHMKKHNNVTL